MTVHYFAQKFTTAGISGGVKIQVDQSNTLGGKGTVPTRMELNLFQWNTNYSTTVAGTALVKERAVIPSEEIEEDMMWVYMFWKPLPVGTYLWRIDTFGTSANAATGTFQIRRDTTSTHHDAFEDGVSQTYDFYSFIMGLDTESHEKILSYGDTFINGAYSTDAGHGNPQVNRGSVGTPDYANSIYAQDAVVKDGCKVGRIASGSFVKTG